MGYDRHHAIIVTTWKADHALAAQEKAQEIFQSSQVSGMVVPVINEYYSFFIGPDGSKQGWPDSDKGDARREMFLNWMWNSGLYLDWVEIVYGGDGPEAMIVHDKYNFFVSIDKDRAEPI